MTSTLTRRAWLGLAALGAAVAAWRPWPVRAQGHLANLAPEEPIAETMKRLFGGRPIKDGASLITIGMPLIAEDGGSVPIAVEVKSPMTSEDHVKAIYILAEKNPHLIEAVAAISPRPKTQGASRSIYLSERHHEPDRRPVEGRHSDHAQDLLGDEDPRTTRSSES